MRLPFDFVGYHFQLVLSPLPGRAVLSLCRRGGRDGGGTAAKAKSERAIAYLKGVASACRELTTMQDVDTDAGILAHERLKRLYDDASSSFPYNFDPYGSFVLFNALSAARVYYWIRRWETVPDARLELAAEARFREDLYEGSSPDALADLVGRLADAGRVSATGYRDALETAKRECLGDIAQLDSFVLKRASK